MADDRGECQFLWKAIERHKEEINRLRKGQRRNSLLLAALMGTLYGADKAAVFFGL